MKRLNVAFDLDGVLIDLMSVVRVKMMEMYDATWREDNDSFALKTDPPLTNKEIWECIRAAYPLYKQTPVYPWARDLLHKLYNMTEEPIKIVTSRPFDVAYDTLKQGQLIADVPLSIDIVPNSMDKILYLKNYKYFIEDRRQTAYSLATEHNKICFLIDRPYNCPKPADPHGVIRVQNLHSIMAVVDKLVKEVPDEEIYE